MILAACILLALAALLLWTVIRLQSMRRGIERVVEAPQRWENIP